jgi:hypothetical protein
MAKIKITAPNRPVRISTTAGVVLSLKPGEVRYVQPFMATRAASAGCAVGASEEPKPDPERAAQLREVVQMLIDEGNPDHFTSNGRPRLNIVRAMLDFEPSTREVGEAFDALKG